MGDRFCGWKYGRSLFSGARFPYLSLVCALLLVCSFVAPAFASTFVSAPLRAGLAYDDVRDVLYVSNGNAILRYRISSHSYLSPIITGGKLKGMDLSPDRETLAVADESFTDTELWIHVIDLLTGDIKKMMIPREPDEAGTVAVAFGADRSILVSSSSFGTGDVSLRKVALDSGVVTALASVRPDTALCASGDRSIVGFAEGNVADGSFGRYRVADGDILRKQGYAEGTGGFNNDIAVNADGSQYAIPASWGTFVADGELSFSGSVGEYSGPRPVGAAYHPTRPLAFFAWAPTSEVRAFDMRSLSMVGAFDFESLFPATFGVPLTTGKLKVAGNGKYLFSIVEGGVGFVELPVDLGNLPPEADSQMMTTREDEALSINLGVRDADGDPLTFTLTDAPRHGKVSGTLPNLLYSPDPEYAGPDSFSFIVSDGFLNSSPATVMVTVTPVNDPPTFSVSSSQVTVRQGASLQIIPGFVTKISAGPPNESDELVKFMTKVTPADMFSVAPVVNPDGALVFQPAKGKKGTATVTITAVDSGGVANGGEDRSQPRPITIAITK